MKIRYLLIRKLAHVFSVGLFLGWVIFSGSPSQAYSGTSAQTAAPQPGPVFTVNTTADPGLSICSTASCSLRAAITTANAGASSGPHSIQFSLTTPVTITLTSALPIIIGDLTITGPGASQLAISGGGIQRVFKVGRTAALSLTGLAIRRGFTDVNTDGFDGAGIYNDHGTLKIMDSIISDNLSNNDGGGLYNNFGTVAITRSIFMDNFSFHVGGIENLGGKVTVTDSLFRHNHSRVVGAIDNSSTITGTAVLTITNSTFMLNDSTQTSGAGIGNSGKLIVANSTFYGNRASSSGGGIANGGTAQITNSTFYSNTAQLGGNIANGSAGVMTLQNTLVAGSMENCNNQPGGTINAGADNQATDATCGGAVVRTLAQMNFGLLQSGGVQTPVLPVLPGSSAIDAGDDTVCAAPVGAPSYGAGARDQRGVPRPQGTHCDTGAYERISGFSGFFPIFLGHSTLK